MQLQIELITNYPKCSVKRITCFASFTIIRNIKKEPFGTSRFFVKPTSTRHITIHASINAWRGSLVSKQKSF